MFGVEFVSSESSSKAYFHPSSKNQSKSNFVTRITVPPSPSPESSIPIAHIYLSPARTVGEGNHSVVYSADWEIPRNIFVKWDICQECVRKEGEKAFWERKSGKSEVDTTAKLEDIHVDNVPWYRPGVDIEPCKHRLGESFSSLPPPNPPTALVSVIAKLSIQHDRHLANESENYQKFPSWMSEHWSGLTLAWPVRNLSRCGAIVPSWYGYYVPDETEIKKDEKGRVKYLSPIMLLEDCGVPIDYEDLTKRDKYACASLVTRFHYHGWLHNSLAPRNIVISYGDHTLYPYNRDAEVEEAKALMKISKEQGLVPYYALDNENEEDYMKDNQKRFRLIDFGRSTWAGDWVKEKMEYNQKRFDRWAGSEGDEKEEKEKGGQKKELGRTYMEEIFRDVSETYRTRWEEMRRKEKEEINKMMHWWFC
ncbi:hypothetical protein K435DRAFT_670625 [Dendrothele bispora CBS 962.96]|uniref:Protein kinase domain-containing protein n=1 Tax=Dendrothele bispora (strain CBS 962.96) TaxID=1314807 RepID=A0A4S8LVP3_DENBC|nr:hypothetical protein K435DRAFT_670625 [Dendrothele bispora CBS 962.96]